MWKSYAIRMDNQDLWALEARIFLEFTINHLWQEVHRIQGFSWCTLWILLCPDQLLIWWLCEVSETFFLLRGIIKQRIHANHPLSFRSQCWSQEIKWLTNTMNSAQDFWFLSDPWEEWNIITEEVNQWCLSLNELTWFTLLFWWTLLWFFSYLFLKRRILLCYLPFSRCSHKATLVGNLTLIFSINIAGYKCHFFLQTIAYPSEW